MPFLPIFIFTMLSLCGAALAQVQNTPQTPLQNEPQEPVPVKPALNLTLKCFLEQTTEPSTDKDPAVIFNVDYKQGNWSIIRNTQSGKAIQRSETYVIRDISKGTSLAWEGYNPKNPPIKMTGRLSVFGNGNYIYAERLFDTRKVGAAANLVLYLCREQITSQ
jgi:hypothetical protein